MRQQICVQKLQDHVIATISAQKDLLLQSFLHCTPSSSLPPVCQGLTSVCISLTKTQPTNQARPGFAFISCVYFKHYYYDYYLIRPTVASCWCGLQLRTSSSLAQRKWFFARFSEQCRLHLPASTGCGGANRVPPAIWRLWPPRPHPCRMPTLAPGGPQIHCDQRPSPKMGTRGNLLKHANQPLPTLPRWGREVSRLSFFASLRSISRRGSGKSCQ